MTPITQTVLHDPANGLHGNCLSAVLASLLHLPIDAIPVFSDSDRWVRELNVWLRPYGLAYLWFQDQDFSRTLAAFGITGLHHEISGKTTRFSDVSHACVAEDGRLVFDPHPNRDGLNAGIEGCGVFIALEPWKWSAS